MTWPMTTDRPMFSRRNRRLIERNLEGLPPCSSFFSSHSIPRLLLFERRVLSFRVTEIDLEKREGPNSFAERKKSSEKLTVDDLSNFFTIKLMDWRPMEVSDTVYHYDAKTMKLKSQLVVVPLCG